jgi:hypothetical protein
MTLPSTSACPRCAGDYFDSSVRVLDGAYYVCGSCGETWWVHREEDPTSTPLSARDLKLLRRLRRGGFAMPATPSTMVH